MKKLCLSIAMLFVISCSTFSQNIDSLFKAGMGKYKSNDFAGAIKDFDTIIKYRPVKLEYYNNRATFKKALKDWDGAIKDYSEVIKLDTTKKAIPFYNLAFCKNEKADQTGAITDLTKAIELSKDSKEKSKAYFFRATINKNLKKIPEAIADFKGATDNDSTLVDAYLNSGYLKRDIKDFAGSNSDLAKAVVINPKNAQAFYTRGRNYKDIKDLKNKNELVIEEMSKALEIKVDHTNALIFRGEAYNNLEAKDLKIKDKKSCADWQKAKELGDKNAQAYLTQFCTEKPKQK
jgi:tetratricopeptide (TPR) repeat protein